MEWFTDPQAWVALGTLTAREIVLGIDNIVFISILAGKLPADQQAKARRIGLLFSLAWIVRPTAPLFTVLGHELSGRDLILIAGGLFLLAKSTHKIHQKLEGDEGASSDRVRPSFRGVIARTVLLDAVITAVGMVEQLGVTVAAVVLAITFMLVFAGRISRFVDRQPTVKMLALSFLLLIGVTLIAEGLDRHIPKGYIYFAMALSVLVEFLNFRLRRPKGRHVRLHEPYAPATGPGR